MKKSYTHSELADESHAETHEDGISMMDFLRLLKKRYKSLLVFGVIGVIAAFLIPSSKRFEAIAQIQLSAPSNLNGELQISNELVAPIISRLSQPRALNLLLAGACVHQIRPNTTLDFGKSIIAKSSAWGPNILELKVIGPTSQSAIECATAIVEQIKALQVELSSPYIERAKISIVDVEQRILEIKKLLNDSSLSPKDSSLDYLFNREEIITLVKQRGDLKRMIKFDQNRAAFLSAPIYAANVHISPSAGILFAAGLLGGLLFGVLIALAQEVAAKCKNNMGKVFDVK